MAFHQHQPGGLWHTANHKALSFTWAQMEGFGGAMHHTNMAGSIMHHNLYNHPGLVLAVRKHDQAPYMGGAGSWGQTFKNILGKVMSVGKAAHEAGITSAVGNLINRGLNPGAAPVPMERGEVAPGVRAPDLAQPPAKRNRYAGGHGGGFF